MESNNTDPVRLLKDENYATWSEFRSFFLHFFHRLNFFLFLDFFCIGASAATSATSGASGFCFLAFFSTGLGSSTQSGLSLVGTSVWTALWIFLLNQFFLFSLRAPFAQSPFDSALAEPHQRTSPPLVPERLRIQESLS